MIEPMEHKDVMELAVQLACSYLGSSHSGSTDAEALILSYYRQIRSVESCLSSERSAGDSPETERDILIAVAA